MLTVAYVLKTSAYVSDQRTAHVHRRILDTSSLLKLGAHDIHNFEHADSSTSVVIRLLSPCTTHVPLHTTLIALTSTCCEMECEIRPLLLRTVVAFWGKAAVLHPTVGTPRTCV